jgi:hypothetical protein
MIPSRLIPVLMAEESFTLASEADVLVTRDEVTPAPFEWVLGLNGLITTPAYTQAVYIRRHWADAWQAAPWIHCHQVLWSCAPTIPQAQLTWDYGAISRETYVTQPDSTIWNPRDLDRWYVRIVFSTDTHFYRNDDGDLVADSGREWVGIICFNEHKPSGDLPAGDSAIAGGEQVFSAYGLEKLLAEWPIKKSVWEKVPTVPGLFEGDPPIDGQPGYADTLFPFNPIRRGQQTGNRSAATLGGDDPSYVFSKSRTSTYKWKNRDIVEYLLRWHNPQNSDGVEEVFFYLEEDAAIVELEPLEIDPTGQNVHALLCRLIDRRRLVTWFCEYDSETNWVMLRTRTMTPNNIVLPLKGSPMIPKNRNQRFFQVNGDPATTWADRWPAIEVCDQVIVRGARRLSVGTFSFAQSSLEKGWSTAQETKYQKGASEEAGYADLGTAEKQRRNAEARSRAEVSGVHSDFRIPMTWTFQTGDGSEAGSPTDEVHPTFPDDSDPTIALPVNPRELFVLGHLPLKEGVNYEDLTDPENPPDETNATGKLLGPLVLFKMPKKQGHEDDDDRWVFAHKMGANAELEHRHQKEEHRISCHVEVPEHYPGFAVKVTGGPQHAIGKTAFDPLEHPDVPEKKIDKQPKYDYYDGAMRATLAVPDDRYCQGVYPATPAAGLDIVRIKQIEAGERYRKDYVVTDTVVDINNAGELVRSTGGFVPLETDEDDEHQLRALAKIAWNWYGQRHHVVACESYRVKPRVVVMLGHLITTMGSPPLEDDSFTANTLAVNSVITAISLTWPKGTPEDGAAPRPMMSFETWHGELEPEPLAPAPLNSGPVPFVGTAAPNTLTSEGQRTRLEATMRSMGREMRAALKGTKQ